MERRVLLQVCQKSRKYRVARCKWGKVYSLMRQEPNNKQCQNWKATKVLNITWPKHIMIIGQRLPCKPCRMKSTWTKQIHISTQEPSDETYVSAALLSQGLGLMFYVADHASGWTDCTCAYS